MNYELILWITGVMFLAHWLTYIMGSPAADDINHVDIDAIGFWLPLWLAGRRLRKTNLEDQIGEELLANLAITKGVRLQHQLYRDWRRSRFDVGREFFTWERAITCPICLHWWLTVIFGIVCLAFNLLHARQDLALAAFIYLVNHFLIRKIS